MSIQRRECSQVELSVSCEALTRKKGVSSSYIDQDELADTASKSVKYLHRDGTHK
jgi:hypothetical protein